MTKLKKLISYNVHQRQPQIHARTKSKGLWLVKMHSQNADDRIDVELENSESIELSAMLPLILEQFTEIVGETSPATNASYTIYQRT